jgi:UDP-N-acetylglucosamine 2-epimerase (non-hydrolysing)
MNRLLVTRLSSLHFAATAGAARNLTSEGVEPAAVHITGNTGIDALLYIARSLDSGALRVPLNWTDRLDPARKTIVVTAHRRENFGDGFSRICHALVAIACRPDVQIVYPVHPNPNVSGPVRERLGNHPNILLTNPLDYVSFVDLMRRSYLLLTDSGGIQEEAPSLGKPVLVMRDKTERPEAIDAGTAELVGTSVERIVNAVTELLDSEPKYTKRSLLHNPYGNGQGGHHIARIVRDRLT